ncbi:MULTISPECIES: hypothetical protein [Kitasatospora]|uniref:Uncharacterized protein n=1 Tax=Kitasatospora setae (strain ATCC 33774 / DSM 43861 / JCM 3304 / KCC A-0304 / NBRC 14216 / KM-6054) TaxID=452652 RepID=E4N8N1_KITSK|nr:MULTISPECIES: hypothetical protein [Kitasatospora]BAJ27562.1 hypothetical protein KSE_17380 [Kitasatospora setae KM-6054]
MLEREIELLGQLLEEFGDLRFPPGWYDREPGGISLVTLATTLAGCTAATLDGPLDDRHREHLRQRRVLLADLLPEVAADPYATRYFITLYRMAVLAEEVDDGRAGVSG